MNGQVARAPRFDDRPGSAATARTEALPPLVLDLDAALPAGFAWELALCAARAQPTALPHLALAACRGWAELERACCALPGVALDAVPLAAPVRAALRRSATEGRAVLFLTQSHTPFAQALAGTLSMPCAFVTAPAGEPIADLARIAAIRARCPGGFVVLPGEDAPWARGAPFEGQADHQGDAAIDRQPAPSPLAVWARALRLHQWAKNGLVFVPPLLAGQAANPAAWMLAACAFLAFGLAASTTYLLNDLHDLDHDRAHRSKRFRPLASGALAIPQALLAAGLGLIGCLAFASMGGPAGLATVAAYLGLTLAYTFAIKRVMVVDTVTLAGLFTLRLVAGIAFCGVAGSAWLLAFSMVVFTALALAKRFVEIASARDAGAAAIAGRGYVAEDGPAVMALGAGASAAAVLILALYIVEAPSRSTFYHHPEWLWAAPIALFVWLGRVWLLCGRGALRDDPVEFALTDRASLALGLVILTSFALACLPF